MEPEIVLLRAVGLLIGVPAFLLGVFWLLDRLESWVVKPDERAAEVQALLHQVERAEEVEEAVTRMLAPLDSSRRPRRGRWLTWTGRRRAGASGAGRQAPAPSSDTGQDLRRQEALADAQEALLEASTKQRAEPSDPHQRPDHHGQGESAAGSRSTRSA